MWKNIPITTNIQIQIAKMLKQHEYTQVSEVFKHHRNAAFQGPKFGNLPLIWKTAVSGMSNMSNSNHLSMVHLIYWKCSFHPAKNRIYFDLFLKTGINCRYKNLGILFITKEFVRFILSYIRYSLDNIRNKTQLIFLQIFKSTFIYYIYIYIYIYI